MNTETSFRDAPLSFQVQTLLASEIKSHKQIETLEKELRKLEQELKKTKEFYRKEKLELIQNHNKEIEELSNLVITPLMKKKYKKYSAMFIDDNKLHYKYHQWMKLKFGNEK